MSSRPSAAPRADRGPACQGALAAARDGPGAVLAPCAGLPQLKLGAPSPLEGRPKYLAGPARRRPSRACKLLALGASLCGAAADKEYAVYIDGGSSGSRAFVYRWEARRYDLINLPPKLVRPERVKGTSGSEEFIEVNPGLSSYAHSAETLATLSRGTKGDNGLDSVMAFVINKLKEEGVTGDQALKEIPLYLGCTGGVRMLPVRKREALLWDLRKYFAGPTSKSPFLKNMNNIRVIAGEEEGVYGWLAANYLQGSLGTDNTYGILDLGGASTQITFQPKTPDLLTNSYEVTLTDVAAGAANGASKGDPDSPGSVRLFTHSFLYFGQEQVFARIHAKILELGGEKVREEIKKDAPEVDQPCMPKGSTRKWDPEFQLFLPEGFGAIPEKLVYKGTSDFDRCYDLCREMLLVRPDGLSVEPCYEGEWPNRECRIAGQYFPKVPEGRQFLAVSSYYHLNAFLKPLLIKERSEPPWKLSAYLASIKTLCEMNLEAVQEHNKQFDKPMPERFLTRYCQLGAYAHNLLTRGYGFKNDSRQIDPVNSISGAEFDIGFGFVLKHANNLPWKLNPAAAFQSERRVLVLTMWMGFVGSVFGGCLLLCIRERLLLAIGGKNSRQLGRRSEPGVEMGLRDS